jgi:type I restriction enzyme S subunit
MQGWEIRQLGDALKLEYGKPLPEEDRDDDGAYPAFGANGVKCRSKKFFFGKPSIIVGRKGSAGEITLAQEKFWPLDVTYFVTFDERRYDLIFLYHCLKSLQLTRLAKGVKPGLNRNDVYSIKFAFPSLPEQKRIVAILDEAFEGIGAAVAYAEKNLANARELFDNHLNSVFTKKGEGWVEKSLGDICSNITDGKHGDCSDEKGSGFYFLSAKDIKNETLNYKNAREITEADFKETHRRTNLKPGDILVTNAGTIGRTAIAPDDDRTFRTTFQKSVAILKPIPEIIDGTFCLYGLKANLVHLINLSAGTAQKNLLLRDTRSFKIFMPAKISKQKKIVLQISQIDMEVQRLENIYQQKLGNLAELKQAVLQKAFAGELTAQPEHFLQEAVA